MALRAKSLPQTSPPHDSRVTDLPPLSADRTAVPDAAMVGASVARILASGTLTNGDTVRELELRAAAYLGVRHCIATASGTTALTVALGSVGATGEAAMPAFTSSATLHAVRAGGFEPVFADVDPATMAVSADAVAARIGTRTGVIVATHPLGMPCDVDGLAAVAADYGVRIVFDAASAFGAEHAGRKVGGFGDAEIFSLSSTKVLVAGEGGLIATDDDALATRCRHARGDDERRGPGMGPAGMNARMSELHAAVALASFETLEDRLAWRRALAKRYRLALRDLPGVSFPRAPEGDLGTHREFVVFLGTPFGREVEDVVDTLRMQGVDAHRTCAEPLHRGETVRAHAGPRELPGTDVASAQAVSLPIWDRMRVDDLEAVVRAFRACCAGTVLS